MGGNAEVFGNRIAIKSVEDGNTLYYDSTKFDHIVLRLRAEYTTDIVALKVVKHLESLLTEQIVQVQEELMAS